MREQLGQARIFYSSLAHFSESALLPAAGAPEQRRGVTGYRLLWVCVIREADGPSCNQWGHPQRRERSRYARSKNWMTSLLNTSGASRMVK